MGRAGTWLVSAALLSFGAACGGSASPLASPTSTATSAASTTTATSAVTSTTATTSTATSPTTTTSTTTSTSSTTTSSTTTSSSTTTTVAPLAGPATSCRGVALIGDSTAVGLDGASGVLVGDQVLTTKLAGIGVADVRLEVSGGRSIVETLPGQANGVDAIAAIQSSGFDGCWVIALGTNDAANISAGSNADSATRVNRVLDAVDGERVLWLTASTIRTDGHWARANTVAWNGELATLLAGVPNAVIADWDSVASGEPWFVSDGIHPNGAGLAARSQFIADTLRVFYPG
ncbi:MAG: hypothetical protein AB8G14_04470 [Ilumatobacter sp.]